MALLQDPVAERLARTEVDSGEDFVHYGELGTGYLVQSAGPTWGAKQLDWFLAVDQGKSSA